MSGPLTSVSQTYVTVSLTVTQCRLIQSVIRLASKMSTMRNQRKVRSERNQRELGSNRKQRKVRSENF
eukprot:4376782-Amphidinium_carterae.1